MNKAKLYKITETLLRFIVLAIVIYLLVDILQDKSSSVDWSALVSKLAQAKITLLMVLFGTFINWLIESIKWRSLMANVVQFSIKKAYQAVLSGLLFSLFTPRRIGDIGARAWNVNVNHRKDAIYYSSFSAAAQLQITMIAGLISLPFVYPFIEKQLSFPVEWLFLIVYGMSAIIIYLYFKSNILLRMIHLFSKKWNAKEIPAISFQLRLKTLLLSLFRYCVFLFQFYLILSVLDPNIGVLTASLGISLVFFASAFIPSGLIGDLLLRSTLAFYIFQFLDASPEAGLSAAWFLWICNIFIPSTLAAIQLTMIKRNTAQ